jgi:S-disulfanyl-L-cysteine oxidoreductase SoxD
MTLRPTVGLLLVLSAGCAQPDRTPVTSPRRGWYTEEQALRGKALYEKRCASCHGVDFVPVDDGSPQLAGAAFGYRWKDRTAFDYYERIRTTMPPAEMGTLTPRTTADIVSYLLDSNGFEPGSTELPADAEALKALVLNPRK